MHVRKTAVRLISGLLLSSMLAAPAFAATGIVNTGSSTLRVRSLAGTEGEILASLEHGTKVELLAAAENGWYKILVGELEGYVSSDYVSVG